MPLRNTPTAFGTVARAFHWFMAALIIVTLILIETRGWFPRGNYFRGAFRDWHFQIGVVVFALVWFRLFWRFANAVPPVVPPLPAWQRTLSHVVEWAFYFLMILLPILGVAAVQGEGRTVALLGMQLPTFVGVDKDWAHRVEELHETLGNVMMFLIGLHVAAAIYHRAVRKDNTVARMAG
ncbi:MAG: cytochrome b [Burkholderiales bacterium]